MASSTMAASVVDRIRNTVEEQLFSVRAGTMSCDHRVIDGATGAKFLQTVKKILENPLYLVV